MGNREAIISPRHFLSTMKELFGFVPVEKEIDEKTAKEVAALRAESGKNVANLENNLITKVQQKRQSFGNDMKEDIKQNVSESKCSRKTKKQEQENERM